MVELCRNRPAVSVTATESESIPAVSVGRLSVRETVSAGSTSGAREAVSAAEIVSVVAARGSRCTVAVAAGVA